ncbi:type II toxin-antitoxin system RelE/ParE family toxin [Emticicia sp. TH156]|uniref:type II toxin-antitoxin system RelE/ParE family toxin n=1 Tax=Emticicia sp. TH156 TaxID=2067454 RepID=UPI000C768126|nr:type II toxin-antitoxin system RelE/ParE family toxin [Emticicia sp. TH156]PLK44666.1 addiction module toxin RelE [Emticicia sp. TH156]
MKIEIQTIPRFDKEFKRLSKKYKSLLNDLRTLSELLTDNPQMGTNLGAGLHKIRLGSESKGGGKSGGFRVITYFTEQKQDTETVYLITIYDKSEEENITKKELLKILTNAFD